MNSNFSEEDIKKVAKGTGTTLIGSFAGGGFNFLSQIMIARVLGVEAFGLYALGFAAVRICEIFAKLGLSTGGMRFVSIYKDESKSKLKGVLISSTGITFLNGVLIGILLYFSSDFIAQKIFHKANLTEALQLFALSIPFVSSMGVVSSLLQGFHITKYTVYMGDFVQPLTNLILIVCFHYAGYGLSGIIYSFILSNTAAFITGIFYFKRLFPEFKSLSIKPVYEIKSLISYSIPLLFVGFLYFFLSWTDTLMLGIMKTSQDVGIYKAASQVPLLLLIVLRATNSIYAPLVADLFNKGEIKRIETVFKITTKWVYIIVLPLSLILIFSAKDVISIFGSGFIEKGTSVLIILTFAKFISCITGGVGFTLTMTGRQKLELVNSLALVFINIILNLFLIPWYGVTGAAIATATSIILINLLRLLEVYMLYQIHPYSKNYVKLLVPTILSILFILMFQLLELQSIWNVMISILLVGLTFVIYKKIIGFDDEELYVLSLVKQKFATKLGRIGI